VSGPVVALSIGYMNSPLRMPHCRYWIGRATKIITVYKEPGSVAGTGGRVRYDKGDAQIAVTWFQRDVSGGEERRTFKAWTADKETDDAGPVEGETYSFNSTELRLIYNPEAGPGAIQLDMKPLPPVGGTPLNVVQHTVQRASSRLAHVPRVDYRNIAYRAAEQRVDPPELLWEITAGSERVILENCW
jgi:hypothetical protein